MFFLRIRILGRSGSGLRKKSLIQIREKKTPIRNTAYCSPDNNGAVAEGWPMEGQGLQDGPEQGAPHHQPPDGQVSLHRHLPSHTHHQVRAGHWEHFRDNVSMFLGHNIVGYYIIRHRDLNIFRIFSRSLSSIPLSHCRCREAKKLSRAQLSRQVQIPQFLAINGKMSSPYFNGHLKLKEWVIACLHNYEH